MKPYKSLTGYDTTLTPEEELTFQQQFPSWAQDSQDYDLRGAWKGGAVKAPNGHLPDTWKKPNHITFSDGSIYHGQDGKMGGKWTLSPEDNKTWTFEPSQTNLENTSPKDLKKYFDEYEPDSTLIMPQVPEGME